MMQLNTTSKQKQFRASAIKRAKHHATHIEDIVPVVIQAVFDIADPGSVEGHLYSGALTGSSGWAEFKGKRYWGGYSRERGEIEFRRDNRLGKPVVRFGEGVSKTQIERQLRALRR